MARTAVAEAETNEGANTDGSAQDSTPAEAEAGSGSDAGAVAPKKNEGLIYLLLPSNLVAAIDADMATAGPEFVERTPRSTFLRAKLAQVYGVELPVTPTRQKYANKEERVLANKRAAATKQALIRFMMEEHPEEFAKLQADITARLAAAAAANKNGVATAEAGAEGVGAEGAGADVSAE